MKVQYYCKHCGEKFRLSWEPRYCPRCGKESVSVDHSEARKYAIQLIQELQMDIPVLDSMWRAYVEQKTIVNRKIGTLRQYKHRGIVMEEEIPNVPQQSVRAARRKMNEEEDERTD